jgi:hypothetical protein
MPVATAPTTTSSPAVPRSNSTAISTRPSTTAPTPSTAAASPAPARCAASAAPNPSPAAAPAASTSPQRQHRRGCGQPDDFPGRQRPRLAHQGRAPARSPSPVPTPTPARPSFPPARSPWGRRMFFRRPGHPRRRHPLGRSRLHRNHRPPRCHRRRHPEPRQRHSTIAFADNGDLLDWTGTLNITGSFVPNVSVRFGIDASGLTAAQLAKITVNGVGGYTLNAAGYLGEPVGRHRLHLRRCHAREHHAQRRAAGGPQCRRRHRQLLQPVQPAQCHRHRNRRLLGLTATSPASREIQLF